MLEEAQFFIELEKETPKEEINEDEIKLQYVNYMVKLDILEETTELIRRFEDCKATSYSDTAGRRTIGCGHLDAKKEYEGKNLSSKEMEELLKTDILNRANISNAIKVDLSAD